MGNDNCCFRSKPESKDLQIEKGRSLGIVDHDKSGKDQIIQKRTPREKSEKMDVESIRKTPREDLKKT